MAIFRGLLTALLVVFGAAIAVAQGAGPATALPNGPGLAAKYPADRGLADDPAVLWFEDFEGVEVADLAKRWDSVNNKNERVIAWQEDVPIGALGKRSIELSATVSENDGGYLYKKLPREVDTAFARFYVKFPQDAGYIHHFVHFGGYRPATRWPQGGAGDRPRGDERMTVGIEPYGDSGRLQPPGYWNFYPYWHEMKASVGNRYWGNSITPPQPAVVPRDKWQCVEIMLKANTPGERDGELALWLDGQLSMHVRRGSPRGEWTGMGFRLLEEGGEPFEGFSWRTSPELRINFFWLLHYVTDTNQRRNRVGDKSAPVRVQFDNIVVSEKYVGPIVE
jgi:hypothetical protein